MVEQLSAGYYMILMSINTLILIPVMFSIGIFFQKLREIQETIFPLKLLGKNESKIFENVLANCLQLEDKYPEFDVLPRIDICQGYNFALKLFKLGLISSILYNIYLLNFLYDRFRLRLPISIICISLAVPFVLNLRSNTWMVDLFELTLIFLAYSMIISYYLVSDSQSH
jgi:hypothetical protein